MKIRLYLFFLLLAPLFSNADIRYVSCTELDETSNPTYYLSKLNTGEVSLPFKSTDPAQSRAVTYIQKKLQEKTQQKLICHEFPGTAELADTPETDASPFTTWHFKDRQIDLTTVVVDYQTMRQLALGSNLVSAPPGNFVDNNSSLPLATKNNYLTADVKSTGTRPYLHWILAGLTETGVLCHVFGYQQSALLFSATSLIGSSRILTSLALSAAISYMAYKLFLLKIETINDYVTYDSSLEKYYISDEQSFSSLEEADFQLVDKGMDIWAQHSTAINAEYNNIFEHYKYNLNINNHYGSWVGSEYESELNEAVKEDYTKLQEQHKLLADNFDLATTATNSVLGMFGLVLKNLTNFASIGIAAATLTQEALNYGLDHYCRGSWEEACLEFWSYSESESLYSLPNLKYVAKRIGTRHLLPAGAILLFAMRWFSGQSLRIRIRIIISI